MKISVDRNLCGPTERIGLIMDAGLEREASGIGGTAIAWH